MASPSHEYMLVGFSEQVDRRPLAFVEALPATKVCSACGLVPKAISLHQCEHFFCKPCYEQCLRHGVVVCPLDGEACLQEEVSWINHSTKSVLAKKVLCWNHRNGCNVITTAADISRHFRHECGHHSARCPRCSTEVLASDVCAHLESRCDASREPGAAAAQSGTVPQEQECLGATSSEIADGFRQIHNVISMGMTSIQVELEDISRTLKIYVCATTSRQEDTDERDMRTKLLQEGLYQIRIQTARLKYHLGEFMQNVCANHQTFLNSFVGKNEPFKKSLTDTVPSRMDLCELAAEFASFRQAMGEGQREARAELDRLALAVERQYDRMSELLRSTNVCRETWTVNSQGCAEAPTESLEENVSKIAWAKNITSEGRQNALTLLPSIMPVATTHTWTLLDYCSLKQRAQSEHYPKRMEQPVYLRGYYVSFGIQFYDQEKAYLVFELHQGKIDRYLEWPFDLRVKWSILHPHGIQKLEDCVMPNRVPRYEDRFAVPKGPFTCRNVVHSVRFTTESLESEGFIEHGRMLLRLSLEDPTPDEEP